MATRTASVKRYATDPTSFSVGQLGAFKAHLTMGRYELEGLARE